jgi:hypothetical protein
MAGRRVNICIHFSRHGSTSIKQKVKEEEPCSLDFKMVSVGCTSIKQKVKGEEPLLKVNQ